MRAAAIDSELRLPEPSQPLVATECLVGIVLAACDESEDAWEVGDLVGDGIDEHVDRASHGVADRGPAAEESEAHFARGRSFPFRAFRALRAGERSRASRSDPGGETPNDREEEQLDLPFQPPPAPQH